MAPQQKGFSWSNIGVGAVMNMFEVRKRVYAGIYIKMLIVYIEGVHLGPASGSRQDTNGIE
jgi:hypothetical protein